MHKQIYGLILICFNLSWVNADIVHDQSFGASQQLSGPDYQINTDKGLKAGNNLFYSFEQFNLATDESATFNAYPQTQHIISRVTGGNISAINGVIHSPQTANFYFFNPAGIVFGEFASLDINAAFYASTADVLNFSDQQTLSLTDINASQWSSADPSAFGFNQTAEISLNNTQINLDAHQSLHLSANTISATNTLLQNNGNIQLYAIDKNNLLDLNKNITPFATQSKIQLQNSQINQSSNTAGILISAADIELNNSQINMINQSNIMNTLNPAHIQITANNMQLTQNSFIAQLAAALDDAGDININISDTLTIDTKSSIRNRSRSLGSAGNIKINANTVNMTNDSYISSSHFSLGNGGNIQIDAKQLNISAANSFIASQSNSTSVNNSEVGNAGSMQLNIDNIRISGGASLVSSTKGAGNAGEIHINSQTLSLTGEGDTGLSSRIQLTSSSTGAAGKVTIASTDVLLDKGSFIATDSLTSGAGGSISINSQHLRLGGQNNGGFGSFIVANVDGNATGAKIDIVSDVVTLTEGAQIATASFGKGNGGNIDITANISLNIDGEDSNGFQSGLFASSLGSDNSAAKGGYIKVQTGQLNLNNQARINTETTSQGIGGTIQIQAKKIYITDQAQIQANSLGLGNAGNIILQAGDSIILQQGKINTSSTEADGGNITISTPSYLYLDQAEISTSVLTEQGNGGNIELTPEFLLLDQGRIIAKAISGDGGHINIKTSAIYRFSPSIINASSELGIDGIVAINSPDIDISDSLMTFIVAFNDSKLSHSVCQSTKTGEENSQMLVLQYLGSPLTSDDWQPSHTHYLAQLDKTTNTDQITNIQNRAIFRLVCADLKPISKPT